MTSSNEQPGNDTETRQDYIKGDREYIYNKLNALGENMTQAEYLSILLTALTCGVIDEKFYIKYRDMGFTQGIPFQNMAKNLRDFLLPLVSNPDKAGETAPGISEVISDAANSVTG